MRVIQNQFIGDWDYCPRTWKERLFTRPWKPFMRFRKVYSPKAFKLHNGTLLVSPESYAKLVREKCKTR